MQSARRARQSLAIARKLVAKQPQAARKSLARRLQHASQSILTESKMVPQSGQNRASEGRKSSQDRPGRSQERPKSTQEPPKSAQERPRALQERPKSGQEGRRRPRSPLKAPLGALGDHFEAWKLEKYNFDSDPSRDSLEKRVLNDFRRFSKHAHKHRTSISKRPYGIF